MKRKVLAALSLVMWIFACCTVFSFKVEDLMTARIITAERPSFGKIYLPLETAFLDETGWHLYYTYEGTGWESGTRVAELESEYYTVYDDPEAVDEETGMKIQPHVEASSPWEGKLIQYSAHPLTDGESALVLDKRSHWDDTWLVISAQPLPEVLTLPAGLALAARTDTSLLLTVPDAPQPFLESEARARLANTAELADQITPLQRDDLRVYSLADAEAFVNAMPRLATILVLSLAPVFLLPPLSLLRTGRYRRVLIAVNGSLTVFAAAAICRETHAVTLPASLLPAHMALDLRHYAGELGQIFVSLGTLLDNSIIKTITSAYASAHQESITILLAGISLTITILALEILINRMLGKR